MSWRFAGIIFKKNYSPSYEMLLGHLGVQLSAPAEELNFSRAISYQMQGTALGAVNGKTLLLNRFLPYDCSYEPGDEGPLDERLRSLSLAGDILNFIFDGVSGTYAFSLFHQAERIRRWAAEVGNVWCDEGRPIAGERRPAADEPAAADDLPAIFAPNADEIHLFAVWEAFLEVSFQELVQAERPLFQLFD